MNHFVKYYLLFGLDKALYSALNPNFCVRPELFPVLNTRNRLLPVETKGLYTVAFKPQSLPRSGDDTFEPS